MVEIEIGGEAPAAGQQTRRTTDRTGRHLRRKSSWQWQMRTTRAAERKQWQK
jgi:hypothetical protein